MTHDEVSAVHVDQKITRVHGSAVPLRGDDIDTDRIIPARFLRCVTFEGLGDHVFEDERRAAGGSHPFDQQRFQGACVLVVGRNFGCGSSREHAPQSLVRWGISGIVGGSFAEIFFGNCVALGIPCLTLAKEDVEALYSAVEADPAMNVTLDIQGKQVVAGEMSCRAGLPDGVRVSFLSGTWDASRLLLKKPAEVAAIAGRLPYLNAFVNESPRA